MLKKKRSIILSILCVISIFLTACSLIGNNAVITCDGFELKLGKTTVANLKEAGFTNLYSHIDKKQIDSMTWENFYAIKDNVSYWTMLAGNKSSSKVEFILTTKNICQLSCITSEHSCNEI